MIVKRLLVIHILYSQGQYMKFESLLDESSVETIAKKLLRRRNKRVSVLRDFNNIYYHC